MGQSEHQDSGRVRRRTGAMAQALLPQGPLFAYSSPSPRLIADGGAYRAENLRANCRGAAGMPLLVAADSHSRTRSRLFLPTNPTVKAQVHAEDEASR